MDQISTVILLPLFWRSTYLQLAAVLGLVTNENNFHNYFEFETYFVIKYFGVKPRPNALDFSLYIARQMSRIVECCREGVAKRSRLSLDLELNIPRMYYLTNNSFMECFVHYVMNSNCTCVRSTTLENFALGQTSLDKKQSSRLPSTRWPNDLDISLNMHVEHCIVKSRKRLARALDLHTSNWKCNHTQKVMQNLLSHIYNSGQNSWKTSQMSANFLY